ncbi:probable glutathione S-transferase GSTU6 [Lolium perenne]|uniref:probable glutathione S-transferase GSTU6 n=1 Tax=Lolium perenne TaxID=4522 RepID=UPI0021EA7C93|nr:probable glutathione S-transferase GSTU6 [Lolium perenne]
MAGAGHELKLVGMWASPFVTRVKLALHLKGLSYDYVEEDLSSKSELLLSSNPVHKTVPVFIHGGRPVCESHIIVQYIDEAFVAAADGSPPLLPADPYERATALFWAAYIDDKVLKPWRRVFSARTGEERAEWMEQAVAAVDALEGVLAGSKEGGFFGGDSVGYVDVLLGGIVRWVHATAAISGDELFDAARTPLLAAWMERFGELDAAKAVFQDVDKVVDYAKMIMALFAAGSAAT